MAVESTITFAASPANLVLNPIRSEWILEGNPVARAELLSSSADGTASTYFWDCTAGRFNWFYGFDETLYILEGSVSLLDPNGKSRIVAVGDMVYFPKGSSAEWTVEKYVRKLAFCRTPMPEYLALARRVARRLKRLGRGKQPDSGLL